MHSDVLTSLHKTLYIYDLATNLSIPQSFHLSSFTFLSTHLALIWGRYFPTGAMCILWVIQLWAQYCRKQGGPCLMENNLIIWSIDLIALTYHWHLISGSLPQLYITQGVNTSIGLSISQGSLCYVGNMFSSGRSNARCHGSLARWGGLKSFCALL